MGKRLIHNIRSHGNRVLLGEGNAMFTSVVGRTKRGGSSLQNKIGAEHKQLAAVVASSDDIDN